MLGLYDGPVPSFVKQYASLGDDIVEAARAYADDVRTGRYSATDVESGAITLGDASYPGD